MWNKARAKIPLNFAVPPPIMRDGNRSKMKAPPAFSIPLAIFALIAALSLASVEAAPRRSGQITHVVLFWLKRPGNVDDQNVLIRASRSFRRIKGVSDVRVGHSLPVERPVEQSFDVGVVITFKDVRALKKFERNQRHQQVVEAALRPLVRRYIVYNFSNE
jgi:Stress responsive A/B Barrel Domain